MRTQTTNIAICAATLGVCLVTAAPTRGQTNNPPAKSAGPTKNYIWMSGPANSKAAAKAAANKPDASRAKPVMVAQAAPAPAAVADQPKPKSAGSEGRYIMMSAAANSKAAPATPARASAPQPNPAPPQGLTPKEMKLAELLAVYRLDKITPHQYQEQRAKILAE